MDEKLYQSLLDTIDQSTIILTPNRRLAATLHQLHQEKQRSNQQTAWITPVILPVTTWIQLLWKKLLDNPFNTLPLLLNAAQENLLWENIIKQVTEHSPLLRVSVAANTAKSAWQLVKAWRADVHDEHFDNAPDYQIFKQCAHQFEMLCKKNHWIDQSSMISLLIEYAEKKQLLILEKIMLVGFTEISPQLSALFTSTNASVESYQLKNNTNAYLLDFSDSEEELITLARYAKYCYEKDKTIRQGFVIPDLDKTRDRVSQIFSTIFNDETAFNISAGKNLSQYPIIHAALLFFSLNTRMLSIDTLSYLFHSPFLGESEREQSARAKTDSYIRGRNLRHITKEQLFQYIESCQMLSKRLKAFFSYIEALPTHQSHTAWIHDLMALLKALGWPGERSINSHEFQVTDHFLKTLETLYSLDLINDSVTYAHMIQTIQKTMATSVFQPKTPDAPIQVLGTLEALGLPFDQLWVTGMSDMTWPAQPNPNPFIPKSLQRELNMPRATAARELEYCKEMTEQFKQSAKKVIFSYAKKQNDLDVIASPLIRNLPNYLLTLPPYQSYEDAIFQSKNIEYLIDEKAPTVDENEKISGGTGILKDQALCPFKSFAKWRLHARDIEKTLPGLNAKERGNLLHKSLELFWKKIQDQHALLNLSAIELKDTVHFCVQDALLAFNKKEYYAENYLKLESNRLETLLLQWLTLEKEREPFVVINSEIKTSITLGALTLNIQIDRIDQLQDHTLLMIDYKSGKNNSVYSFLGDRPDEPQLPIYALTKPDQTAGIAFAQIFPGELEFKGLAQPTLNIKGCKTIHEWSHQLIEWKNVLTTLSNNFYQGNAQVDPKETEKTCQWCNYQSFCRIYEDITP